MNTHARTWLLVASLVFTSGCAGYQELNEVYGRRSGGGASSINGTSALADLFEQAGHRVRSWRYLSPSLEEADVIVWFPHETWNDDTAAPSDEAVTWLDEWLRYSYDERTLIVVGRDWEAAREYWTAAQPLAPPGQKIEFGKRLKEAKQEETSRLAAKVERAKCEWYTISRGNKKQTVTKLEGPFAEGVDANKAALEHWASINDEQGADVLLADGQGHPLVSEYVYSASDVSWTDEDSQLILVENGSFLLNGGLVNQERRKLAGRLVDWVGEPEKRVVFLETTAEPPIRDTDPNPRPPTGLELFTIWPIGAVLVQVAALGVVYALARWPIFGVPRRLTPPALTDFGRHVTALARLLATTRDRAYAVTQLQGYFQTGEPRRSEKLPPQTVSNERTDG